MEVGGERRFAHGEIKHFHYLKKCQCFRVAADITMSFKLSYLLLPVKRLALSYSNSNHFFIGSVFSYCLMEDAVSRLDEVNI